MTSYARLFWLATLMLSIACLGCKPTTPPPVIAPVDNRYVIGTTNIDGRLFYIVHPALLLKVKSLQDELQDCKTR